MFRHPDHVPHTGDIIDRVVVDTTEYDDTTDTDIGNDWKEEDEESAGYWRQFASAEMAARQKYKG